MEPHATEALDVRQVVLGDRQPELQLVAASRRSRPRRRPHSRSASRWCRCEPRASPSGAIVRSTRMKGLTTELRQLYACRRVRYGCRGSCNETGSTTNTCAAATRSDVVAVQRGTPHQTETRPGPLPTTTRPSTSREAVVNRCDEVGVDGHSGHVEPIIPVSTSWFWRPPGADGTSSSRLRVLVIWLGAAVRSVGPLPVPTRALVSPAT